MSPGDSTTASPPSHGHLVLKLNDSDNSFNFLRNFLLAYWCYLWCPKTIKSGPETDLARKFLDDFPCVFEVDGACEDGTSSRTGTGSTNQTTLNGTTATNTSWGAPRKYQKGNGKDNQDPDGRGNKSLRDGTSIVSASQGDKQLVCPWFFQGRWGEVCNQKCRRIGDVRQHIFRRHRQPLHCPSCGLTFDSEAASGAHIAQQACARADFYHAGVTRDQWADICARAQAPPHTVNGGDEERWFQIWDIVFPGQPRPRSPYIEGTILTMQFGNIAHRFLDEGGAWDLIYELFPRGTPNVHPEYRQQLHQLAEDLIGRLIARAGEEDRSHDFNRAP
ncbi:hypothetical protein PG988_006312 [Apiospora saccharicola]